MTKEKLYAVQETNQSSLKSKRAMELAGYLDDEQEGEKDKTSLFEPFLSGPVSKRSSLIHWGYYLRHKTMDLLVTHILERYFTKGKGRIVSLGCGMDGLYFRLKRKGLVNFRHCLEIDLTATVARKVARIQASPYLCSLLDAKAQFATTWLRSTCYSIESADLRKVQSLACFFENEASFAEPVLILSECVLSYLKPIESDRLIQWLGQACLAQGCPVLFLFYEQALCYDDPQEMDAFSLQMQQHFDRQASPIASAVRYSTTRLQMDRLKALGWSCSAALSLSDVWAAFETRHQAEEALPFLSALPQLLFKEPFDEWEEWDVKLAHYMVCLATLTSSLFMPLCQGWMALEKKSTLATKLSSNDDAAMTSSRSLPSIDRWGHATVLLEGEPAAGAASPLILSFGGYGKNEFGHHRRLHQLYAWHMATEMEHSLFISEPESRRPQPIARVHHTMVAIGPRDWLLFGGRSNPKQALNDLWRGSFLQGGQPAEHSFSWSSLAPSFHSTQQQQQQPLAVYRHAATFHLPSQSLIISGGLTGDHASAVSAQLFLYDLAAQSWRQPDVIVTSSPPGQKRNPWARFSHTLHFISLAQDDDLVVQVLKRFPLQRGSTATHYGRLYGIGGRVIAQEEAEQESFPFACLILVPLIDGCIAPCAYPWIQVAQCDFSLFPICTTARESVRCEPPSRYAHSSHLLWLRDQPYLLVLGGLVRGTVSHSRAVVRYSTTWHLLLLNLQDNTWSLLTDSLLSTVCFPVRHTSVLWPIPSPESMAQHCTSSFQCLILGGGLTCFSMGTFFSPTLSTILSIPHPSSSPLSFMPPIYDYRKETRPIPFLDWYVLQRPMVFRGMRLGEIQGWHHTDLVIQGAEAEAEAEGRRGDCEDPLVSVHVSSSPSLFFHDRNYRYVVMRFSELIRRLFTSEEEEPKLYYYLRSLGTEPRREVAQLAESFPRLARAFACPLHAWMPDAEGKIFSSILRISSPRLRLWLHYDVLDNVLCQIWGHKRVYLWPPSELPYLSIQGSSSSLRVEPVDEDGQLSSACYQQAQKPWQVDLAPGDVLFIPALWFHYVVAGASGPSLSINVFWREEDASLYDPKDLFGNRDLLPAQKALEKVRAASQTLSTLPRRYRSFYHLKLAATLASPFS